jgi:chorismate mutase/prephenate dehydratase
MNELDEARRQIDGIDRRMAELFSERMGAVRRVAEWKRAHGLPVRDPVREAEMLEREAALVADAEVRPYYLTVLQRMMDVSRQFQHRLARGARVAYSGTEGAFAHIAAKRIFPDGEKLGFGSFEDAYRAVEAGECDCAVLPIENSYAGEVGQVLDLMFRGGLHVNGVYGLRVSHCLLGVPGARLEGVRRVVSHPQALEQCDRYIRRHGFEAEQASNTARAAEKVAKAGDAAVAAIASAETAALHGLEVLESDINESAGNTTRFGVFSRAEAWEGGGPGSGFILLFTVRHEAGALAKAVEAIGGHGFNMRVLRSRALKGEAWRYYFYVEAEGDETSERGRAMLAELAERCESVKVAGHFAAESLREAPEAGEEEERA